jgi:plasmid stabilization system protein ParE
MTRRIIFRDDAESEMREAAKWYNDRSARLGDEFLEAIDAAIRRIANSPLLFERVHRDVRQCIVRRFPYVIYFRDVGDRIEVIAVVHGRRSPRIWRRRI